MGRTYSKFVGLSVALLGGWILIVNLFQTFSYDAIWVWAWVILSGMAGLSGGFLFLFSFDGPIPFRTRRWRLLGWSLMLVSVALPTSLTLMLVPLVLFSLPAVFKAQSVAVTSS